MGDCTQLMPRIITCRSCASCETDPILFYFICCSIWQSSWVLKKLLYKQDRVRLLHLSTLVSYHSFPSTVIWMHALEIQLKCLCNLCFHEGPDLCPELVCFARLCTGRSRSTLLTSGLSLRLSHIIPCVVSGVRRWRLCLEQRHGVGLIAYTCHCFSWYVLKRLGQSDLLSQASFNRSDLLGLDLT